MSFAQKAGRRKGYMREFEEYPEEWFDGDVEETENIYDLINLIEEQGEIDVG